MPTVDGSLGDWTGAQRLDRPGTLGNLPPDAFKLFGVLQNQVLEGGVLGSPKYYFAIEAPGALLGGTNLAFDIDRNSATGDAASWGREAYVVYTPAAGNVAATLSLFYGYDANGYKFAAITDFALSADGKALEFGIDANLIDLDGSIDIRGGVNSEGGNTPLPGIYSDHTYTLVPDAVPQTIDTSFKIDGIKGSEGFTEASTLLGGTSQKLYVADAGEYYVVTVTSDTAIDAGSTIKLDMDRAATTGQGREFEIKLAPNLVANLTNGFSVNKTDISYGLSEDQKTLEIALLKSDIAPGSDAFDVRFALNYNAAIVAEGTFRTGAPVAQDDIHRIAIVYSDTSAKGYFSETAYNQLFLAAQNQATQAGIPFDILTESQLTDVNNLKGYDAIVFPSFDRVQEAQYQQIFNALQQASDQYHVGLIAAGDFMTNYANGAAVPGYSYQSMVSLFGVKYDASASGATVDLKGSGGHPGFDYAAGEEIHTYTNAGTSMYSATGAATTIATQTVNGDSHAAVIATETGGRNVHFATTAFLGDNNMLQQAIDWSSQGDTPALSLSMSRGTSIVSSRNDMDQSQYADQVDPAGNAPGIYDKLMPLLETWKTAYNFVGSYYVNVGDGTGEDAANSHTNWTISRPIYDRLVAMGNELGSHSYTHPHITDEFTIDTRTGSPTLGQIVRNWEIPEGQSYQDFIKYQFEKSKLDLQSNMSDPGNQFIITGAAVPGAPETITTAREILNYYQYLSGGYSGVNAGYPGAIGILPPNGLDSKVYIAPNVTFDFTQIGFLKKTPAQAEAAWAKEWADLNSHSDTPVIVWPWHDYGPTLWEPGYSEAMFTNFIKRAYDTGAEFVTLTDLAERIKAFQATEFSYSVSGNTITATVGVSSGKFDLDLDTAKIHNVGTGATGWYAFDDDSVFLTKNGGTFTINTGASLDDVTHLYKLSMRSELVSVSGDGKNLTFTVNGEGKFEVKLSGTGEYDVNGGTATKVGDLLTVDVGAYGSHTVEIKARNTAPVTSALNEDTTGTEDIAVSGALKLGTDAENNPLTFKVGPTVAVGGTVLIDSAGNYTFTPAPDFNGEAKFTYVLNDGQLDSLEKTVKIAFAAVNDAPVASTADENKTDGVEDTIFTGTLEKGADVDNPVESLTFKVGPTPAVGGAVEIDATTGVYKFTPAANFNGAASFSYVVSDGLLDSTAKTVTIAFSAVNDAPTFASAQEHETTGRNQAVSKTLLAGADVDNDQLTYLAGQTPVVGGTVEINPTTGAYTFTPAHNFTGSASFTYVVFDGTVASGEKTVTINVSENQKPVAATAAEHNADGIEDNQAAGKLLEGTDGDNDPLIYKLVDGSAVNGTVVIQPDGNYTFTPTPDFNGTASFQYVVDDLTATSDPKTVTIAFAAVNDKPVAVADAYSGTKGVAIAGNVLTNDLDVDGDALTASLGADPSFGVLELKSDGTFIYTPNANYVGGDSFTYIAHDGVSPSAPVTVTLTIAGAGNPGGGGGGGNPNPNPGQGVAIEVPGTSGNDRFIDTAESEHFLGKEGLDTVVFAGARADYIIVQDSEGMPYSITGPNGEDRFTGVERLEFSDGILAFDPSVAQVYRLYEAAFDRQPDVKGLSFWVDLFDEGAKDLVGTALDFLFSPEFKSTFGDFQTMSDEQIVDILYQNILDRQGEAAGVSYWLGELGNGLSREHLLAMFSESAENIAGTADAIKHGIWLDASMFS